MKIKRTFRILTIISIVVLSIPDTYCQQRPPLVSAGGGEGSEADGRLQNALKQEPWTRRSRAEIESASKDGNAAAKLALAGLYASGREVRRDPVRAAALIREAAEGGLPSACYLVGANYLDDDPGPAGGVQVGDYQSASEWLEKAASKGHIEAAHQLGELYYLGKLKYDYNLAGKWLRMAAEAGDARAAADLPFLYFFNHPGFTRDRAEGLRWMRVVAGHPPAGERDVRVQYARWVLADHPSVGEKSEAEQWLRQAMDSGSAQALATLDALGEPVPAADALQVQALEDDCGMSPGTPACWRVARIYEVGRDVPKDLGKALRCYARCSSLTDANDPICNLIAGQAAEGIVRILASPEFVAPKNMSVSALLPNDVNLVTNPAVRLQLAQLLWTGTEAVPPNRAQAVEWFSVAAKSGSAEAMFRLGDLWQQGVNGKPDASEALRWYRRAATVGFVPAQLKLGQMYLNGGVGETSRIEAYAWLQVASKQGSSEARQLAAELEPKLAQAELDSARQRAEQVRAQIGAK